MKRIMALMAVLWLAAGCASQPYTPADVTSFVWPDPPQRPRVRMVGYVFSDLDVRAQGTSELLFGMEDVFFFDKIHRVVADKSGTIYVSDTIAKRVYVVSFEEGAITQLFAPPGWGIPGGLALDEENGLLAATSGSVIYLFDLETRKFKATLGKGAFTRPAGLAFDPARKILYVADTRMNQVSALDYNGRIIRRIAGPGTQPGQVYWPGGMDVDDEGNLYVVDTMNFRIQIFNPDGSFAGTFGSHGTSVGRFARPKDVAVSKDGLILVTDAAFGNIQIFDREGNVYLYVGRVGTTMDKFTTPQGIFIDDEDKFYVADQGSNFIKIFQLYTDRWYDEHPEEAAKYPAPAGRQAPRVDMGAPSSEDVAEGDTGEPALADVDVAEEEPEKPAFDPEELQRGW